MRARGFFEVFGMTARDLVATGVSGELCAVEASQPIEVAICVMGEHDFSQISVTNNGRIIGSLNEAHLFEEFVRQPDLKGKAVKTSCNRPSPSSTSRRPSNCCRR